MNILTAFLKRINLITKPYYIIGIVNGMNLNPNADSSVRNVTWIKFKNHKINWVADPFLFSVNESSAEILVEEMCYESQKGRIAKLTIDRTTGTLLDKKIILELDTHLSFPIFLRENNKTYVYPENCQGGALRIYEYDFENNKLVNPKILINEPLMDTVIYKIQGCYYAFGVVYTGNHDTTRHLEIFKSDTLMGEYSYFQTIDNVKKWERGAGNIIKKGGKLIRPAQSCEERYGHHVIFQELCFDGSLFCERCVGSLMPSEKYPISIHTYNELDGLSVIDSQRLYWGKFSSVISFLYDAIIKLIK